MLRRADKANRRLVAPPRQHFDSTRPRPAAIARMNLLPLLCFDYYSIIKRKAIRLGGFATFAPASRKH
jgi:hypothetical protein